MAIGSYSNHQLTLVIRQNFIRLIGLFFILIGGAIALNVLQSYQIQCKCQANDDRLSCVLTTQKYFLKSSHTQLGHLKHASVISKRSSEGNINYNVKLQSQMQSIHLSTATTPSYARAQSVANAINAYLVGCPTKPLSISSIQPAWTKLFVLSFPLIGVLLIVIPAKITVTFDKTKNQLTITRSNLFKNNQAIYPLDQINKVTLQESVGRKGGVMYRVALEFKDNTVVPITTAYDSMFRSKSSMANKIRSFLNLDGENTINTKMNTTYSIASMVIFIVVSIVILIIFW
ncbi:cytochrome b-245 chaperone 1/Eros family protein [Legionella yabuuchiae]|uniref:cytochrome b-245 chaperone 1/Eros family protein n=1 Tax=Legionella yabuuchiae TaxID=376727 RepID=UPI0010558CFE|nr:transmembrane domain-containing protein [Legionella yabuuchiae]